MHTEYNIFTALGPLSRVGYYCKIYQNLRARVNK